MTTATGRCLCGAVTFRAEGVETEHHACHCGMCRRWSGGPYFATSAEHVSFEGAENIGRYASSEWADRGFCKVCGTNLFYYLNPADKYNVSVGAFDEASLFRLVGEIYIDHKPIGYEFAGNLPKMTEAEVIAKFMPPEDGGA